MQVLHEKILNENASSFSCRDFKLKTFDCPYHRHREFEILRIDQSGGRILAGDYIGKFKPGEIYLFGGNLPHAFLNPKGTWRARSRCLQFDADRIFESLKIFPETRSTITSLSRKAARGMLIPAEASSPISHILDDLFSRRKLTQLSTLLNLLDSIERLPRYQLLSSEGYQVGSPDRHFQELESTLTYLHQHSAQTITTAHLASMASMSESSFHRHFRQRIGRTPNAYLQNLRLSNIAQRLLESDSPISDIAFSEGFNNLSNFNHQFQRSFKCTPRQYRARHREAL